MLRQLRDAMAGYGTAQERLDRIVQLIVGDSCARRAGFSHRVATYKNPNKPDENGLEEELFVATTSSA